MAVIGNISLNDLITSTRSNQTSSPEHCISELPVRINQVNIAIHVFTILAALIGNCLLIAAYVKMKEKSLLLIANMAASDLLMAPIQLPRLITDNIVGHRTFLVHGSVGTFLCKVCSFLSDISISVSTLSLVLIAVERFQAVVYPVWYKRTSAKRRRHLVALTWIMAAAIHSPYFYTFRLVRSVRNGHDIQECIPSWEPAFENKSAHLYYNIFLFTTVLILPLLIISVLYIVVAFYMHLRKNRMSTCRSEKGERRNRKRIRNLVRMATATVTAFLICWTLYIVTSFIHLFTPRAVPRCSKLFMEASHMAQALAASYCAVNPWICFLFIRKFARELRVMFSKCC